MRRRMPAPAGGACSRRRRLRLRRRRRRARALKPAQRVGIDERVLWQFDRRLSDGGPNANDFRLTPSVACGSIPRWMRPQPIGGSAVRTEVWRTEALKSWPATSPTRVGICSHRPTLTRAAILPELAFGAIIGAVVPIDCVPLEKVSRCSRIGMLSLSTNRNTRFRVSSSLMSAEPGAKSCLRHEEPWEEVSGPICARTSFRSLCHGVPLQDNRAPSDLHRESEVEHPSILWRSRYRPVSRKPPAPDTLDRPGNKVGLQSSRGRTPSG